MFVYALTENAIHAFPNAYGLLLRAFVGVLAKQLSPQTLVGYLRQLGRELARDPAQEAQRQKPNGTAPNRTQTARSRWAASRR